MEDYKLERFGAFVIGRPLKNEPSVCKKRLHKFYSFYIDNTKTFVLVDTYNA